MRAIEFKRFRKGLGLTQQELADRIGISKRQVGRYETAKTAVPNRSAAVMNLLVASSQTEKRKRK